MITDNKIISSFLNLFPHETQEKILSNKNIIASLEQTYQEMTDLFALATINKNNQFFTLEQTILKNCLLDNVYQYQFRKLYFDSKETFIKDKEQLALISETEKKYNSNMSIKSYQFKLENLVV